MRGASARLVVASPLGPLVLLADGDHLAGLDWCAGARPGGDATPLLVEARRQLDAFFGGRLRRFRLPLRFPAPPRHHGVYEALHAVPFGETRTFAEIAAYVGISPQMVGRAVAANPVPIILPGHRLVGAGGRVPSDGRGGARHRSWLLRHEARWR